MVIRKGHHCAYETHYHIVFPVKYRKALLHPEVEAEVKQIATEIGERYEIEFEQIGCDNDHVHIFCSFHPKHSIGDDEPVSITNNLFVSLSLLAIKVTIEYKANEESILIIVVLRCSRFFKVSSSLFSCTSALPLPPRWFSKRAFSEDSKARSIFAPLQYNK